MKKNIIRAQRHELNETIAKALPDFEFNRISDEDQFDTIFIDADKTTIRKNGATVEQRHICIERKTIRKKEVYQIEIS